MCRAPARPATPATNQARFRRRNVSIDDCVDYDAALIRSKPSSTIALTTRNVDVRLKEALRVRAARHGHSMEAELRDIPRRALADEGTRELNLAEAIRRRMAPLGGVELEPHPPVPIREPREFGR